MALLAAETPDRPDVERVSSTEAAPVSGVVPSSQRLRTAFESHYDQIWRLLRRIGVPASVADDATQQVFLFLAERIWDVREGCELSFIFISYSLFDSSLLL